ncbi:MAG: tRNA (N6-threonylcarbamoyladenosine(37)-N6)-methyltransferase TrmO [Verrucomicrobiia bacterium]
MESITYKPIGVIYSPYNDADGVPIQPTAANGCEGTVDIFPEYVEGLKDLDGFSHIILIYHFHLSKRYTLTVKPFLDNQERGVFATRAPARPNAIGISVVELLKIQGNRLLVRGLDVLNGTPLLDIKPYVPEFDSFKVKKIGWLQGNLKKLSSVRADTRFLNSQQENGLKQG